MNIYTHAHTYSDFQVWVIYVGRAGQYTVHKSPEGWCSQSDARCCVNLRNAPIYFLTTRCKDGKTTQRNSIVNRSSDPILAFLWVAFMRLVANLCVTQAPRNACAIVSYYESAFTVARYVQSGNGERQLYSSSTIDDIVQWTSVLFACIWALPPLSEGWALGASETIATRRLERWQCSEAWWDYREM